MEISRACFGIGWLIGVCSLALLCGVTHAQANGGSPGVAPALEKPAAVKQQVTVTATRSSIGFGETGKTVDTLTTDELESYPALTMDERLKQQAGFQLFRRSAGRVQNPTSQGISLRGLGSTAASRTLVIEDGAPLNDPFGGWVHWDEMPAETVDEVTIAAGGGSDLYGSSALGGVVDVAAAEIQSPTLLEGTLAAAGQDTRTGSARVDTGIGPWAGMLATELFRTAGYVLVAPEARGPVDAPANVHYQNGRVEGERRIGVTGKRVFITGNLLNEARGNGTPLTTNGTRLWRYLGGDDWSVGDQASGRIRVFGSDEAYRQTFSSVLSPAGSVVRSVENLTRLQGVRVQELGASTDASVHLGHMAFVAGADVRDIRGTDAERPVTAAVLTGLIDTSARQRFVGAFGEVLGQWGKWSGAGSVRIDHAANLDTRVLLEGSQGSGTSGVVDRTEVVTSPRLGVVRQLGKGAVHASGFRAFRAPTMNELYRTGQVGSETTQANSSLLSERATGWEVGGSFEKKRMVLNGAYFWTEINRPVSAVLVSQTATSILDKRENLGQIRSDGVELKLELNGGGIVSAAVGYQFADAVVTKFPAHTSLVGNWIPEVPRNSATAQVRARNSRLGELTIAARESGRAFDDSANQYVLHSFFVLDASAERGLGRGFTAFISGQNLLGRRVDVARTPVLTLGSPVMVEGGVRCQWGGGVPQH